MNVFLMIMRKIQPHSCQIITDNNFFRVILRIKSYNCLFYKRFVKKMLLISNESDYEGSIWPVSRRINRFLINSLERYLNFSGSNIEINFKKKLNTDMNLEKASHCFHCRFEIRRSFDLKSSLVCVAFLRLSFSNNCLSMPLLLLH